MMRGIILYISVLTILISLSAYNLFNYLAKQEFSLLNLDIRGEEQQLVSTRSGELLKGDKVWGHFHSDFTNLGIVSVRFYNGNRDSKDTLLFRLREEGQQRWYYEAKYETDQFLPHKFFSFGFPIIKNSNNKNYEFQLESLGGATGSGIFLDRGEPPAFIAKSFYTKADLSKDRGLLIYFIKNKVINILGDPEMIGNLLVSFLPLVLFLVFVFSSGLSYQYLIIVMATLVLTEILFSKSSYSFLYLSSLFFWGLISHRYHFEAKIAALLGLLFLVLTLAMTLFGQSDLAEKISVWAYLFLSITAVQKLYEARKTTPTPLTLKTFTDDFPNFKSNHKPLLTKASEQRLDLICYFLVCLFIFLRFFKIAQAFSKFSFFYPTNTLLRFFSLLLVPELILTLILFLVLVYSVKTIKKTKIILLLMLLIFNFFSARILSTATKFEYTPIIISVTPNETSEAWVDIFITGKNFQDVPFVGKVYIDGIEQGEYVLYWSDRKVVVRTSPAITKSGNICISTLTKGNSNCVPFKYSFGKSKELQ